MSSPGPPSGCAEALARVAAVRSSASRRTRSSSNASRERPTSASGSDRGGEALRAHPHEAAGARTRAAAAGTSSPTSRTSSQRLRMEVAQLLLRDVLRRRVDGREVARLRVAVQVVRRDREAVAVRAARGYEETCPATSFVSSQGWLNHVALISPGLVRDARGEDLQATAPPTGRRADDDLDDRLLVPEEIADPLRRRRLLVAPRTLPEDVARPCRARAWRAGGRSSARRPARTRPTPRADRNAARTAAAASARAHRCRRMRRASPPRREDRSRPRRSGVDRQRVQPAGLPPERALDELVEGCSLEDVVERPLGRGVADDGNPPLGVARGRSWRKLRTRATTST